MTDSRLHAAGSANCCVFEVIEVLTAARCQTLATRLREAGWFRVMQLDALVSCLPTVCSTLIKDVQPKLIAMGMCYSVSVSWEDRGSLRPRVFFFFFCTFDCVYARYDTTNSRYFFSIEPIITQPRYGPL